MSDIDNILQYPAVYEQTHQVSILYCSLHINLCQTDGDKSPQESDGNHGNDDDHSNHANDDDDDDIYDQNIVHNWSEVNLEAIIYQLVNIQKYILFKQIEIK